MIEGWWDPGWFWLIGFGQLLFWIALILLVAAIVRRRPQGDLPGRRGSDALAILEERYARGEIDRDEFRERRAVLIDEAGR